MIRELATPWKILIGVLFVLILVLFLRALSPSHQVAGRQASLLRSVESARWEKLEAMLHPEFADGWGLGKEKGLIALQQLRGQFLLLAITEEGEPELTIDQSTAHYIIPLTLGGSGSGFIKEIVKRANEVKTPYTFHWEKTGRGKSGWLLRGVSNPDLEIGDLPSQL